MLNFLAYCNASKYKSATLQRPAYTHTQSPPLTRHGRTHVIEELLHGLGLVINGEDDIRDTSGDQRLNLVQDHGLIAKLNERLGQREGLKGSHRPG